MFSQYHKKLEQIIKKQKRVESILHGGPSEFVQNLVKNLKLEENEKLCQKPKDMFAALI